MASSFAASALRHPHAFVTPESLQLLVVDRPSLGPGVVVGGPGTCAPYAQPVSSRVNPKQTAPCISMIRRT